MGFSDIILISFLAFRNAARAKQKEQSQGLWAFITIILFLICEGIGSLFVVLFFCRDLIDFNRLGNPKDLAYQDQFRQQLMQDFNNNPLHVITIILFGMGGYLIVRYILEKRPTKIKPEIHWMDKIGEQE